MKRWSVTLIGTMAVMGLMTFVSVSRPGVSLPAPAMSAAGLLEIDQLEVLEPELLELVGDFSQDGNFRRMKAPHLVTFVTFKNAQPDRHAWEFADLKDFSCYRRLLFGDHYDNEEDKNHCHFRFRIREPSSLPCPYQSLLLHLESATDKKQLRFEWVNGSLVSHPFIMVDQLKQPTIPGLTELLSDAGDPSYRYSILNANPP